MFGLFLKIKNPRLNAQYKRSLDKIFENNKDGVCFVNTAKKSSKTITKKEFLKLISI